MPSTAEKKSTPSQKMSAKQIAVWALKNKAEARALGQRLFELQDSPEKLKAAESLGEFQDRATAWAIKHPNKARILMLRLAPKLIG